MSINITIFLLTSFYKRVKCKENRKKDFYTDVIKKIINQLKICRKLYETKYCLEKMVNKMVFKKRKSHIEIAREAFKKGDLEEQKRLMNQII